MSNFLLTRSPTYVNVRLVLNTDKESLSPSDVALMIRKSAKTVVRWGDEGRLGPLTLTEGGQRRFQRDAIEAFIAARETAA